MLTDNHSKRHSVFFSRKALDNATVVEIEAFSEELEGRAAYGFEARLWLGEDNDTVEVCDVTECRETAEELFDLLSRGNIFPCQLCEVVEDYVTAISSVMYGEAVAT